MKRHDRLAALSFAVITWAAFAPFGAPRAANAANLLENPGFDATLARWQVPTGPQVTWSLADDDAGGECGSHAARVVESDDTQFYAIGQCVTVSGGAPYETGIWHRSEPDGTSFFTSAVLVSWFAQPGCGGDPVKQEANFALEFPGRWFPLRLAATSPAGVVSALVQFGATGDDGANVVFDEAAFCPAGTCGLGQAPVLAPAEFPDFRFRVLVATGDGDVAGKLEPPASCLPDTACVSGALAGRTEVMLRVIGPRPNGFLWFQAVRFTPSRVVVEATQVSTGMVRHYLLPESEVDARPLSVEDRTAFEP